MWTVELLLQGILWDVPSEVICSIVWRNAQTQHERQIWHGDHVCGNGPRSRWNLWIFWIPKKDYEYWKYQQRHPRGGQFLVKPLVKTYLYERFFGRTTNDEESVQRIRRRNLAQQERFEKRCAIPKKSWKAVGLGHRSSWNLWWTGDGVCHHDVGLWLY